MTTVNGVGKAYVHLLLIKICGKTMKKARLESFAIWL